MCMAQGVYKHREMGDTRHPNTSLCRILESLVFHSSWHMKHTRSLAIGKYHEGIYKAYLSKGDHYKMKNTRQYTVAL